MRREGHAQTLPRMHLLGGGRGVKDVCTAQASTRLRETAGGRAHSQEVVSHTGLQNPMCEALVVGRGFFQSVPV